MTEQDIRRHLRWLGAEEDEIEDEIAAWADAENDRRAEEEYLRENTK